VRKDITPQARKNRRCIRWNTLRIFSGRARGSWSRIVRRSRTVTIGQISKGRGYEHFKSGTGLAEIAVSRLRLRLSKVPTLCSQSQPDPQPSLTLANPSRKGDSAMVQVILQVLIVGLLTGLVGIIWMIARNSLTDDHDPDDNRQGETPRQNRMTERNHTNAHPGSQRLM
jgi:hypothetical protein